VCGNSARTDLCGGRPVTLPRTCMTGILAGVACLEVELSENNVVTFPIDASHYDATPFWIGVSIAPAALAIPALARIPCAVVRWRGTKSNRRL
jgi:hypothetical protein